MLTTSVASEVLWFFFLLCASSYPGGAPPPRPALVCFAHASLKCLLTAQCPFMPPPIMPSLMQVKEHLDKVLVLLDELLLMERELQYFKSYGAD